MVSKGENRSSRSWYYVQTASASCMWASPSFQYVGGDVSVLTECMVDIYVGTTQGGSSRLSHALRDKYACRMLCMRVGSDSLGDSRVFVPCAFQHVHWLHFICIPPRKPSYHTILVRFSWLFARSLAERKAWEPHEKTRAIGFRVGDRPRAI
jgi:hypothetical protein